MSLSLSCISFRDFRSYQAFNLDDIGSLTLFIGPNATGKTNIIEGIQLLTAHTSFRNPTVEQLIRFSSSTGYVSGSLVDDVRDLTVEVRFLEGRKKHLLNGKPKRVSDLKGLLPSVIFTPDDIALVKGAMSLRRSALDTLGSQLSPAHYQLVRDYERIVRHKNQLLKDDASDLLIDSINEMLITCGAQLSCYRAALLRRLSGPLSSFYFGMTNSQEELSTSYIPSWDETDSLAIQVDSFTQTEARLALEKALSIKKFEERARRKSLVGPHADRIEFFIDNQKANIFASQGQQRSVVLSFKLAEASVIYEMTGQQPVLLLDDVMSELDDVRRRALVSFISGGIQTFVTSTNLEYFDKDLLNSARIVKLGEKCKGISFVSSLGGEKE